MTEHQHEYFGGVCLCGKKQPRIVNGKEVGLSDISGIKTAQKPKYKPTKKITSQFQFFVDDLMVFLGEDIYKKGNFSKYCGVVKRYGMFQVGIWKKEMQRKGISKPAYFWGIVRNFNKLK